MSGRGTPSRTSSIDDTNSDDSDQFPSDLTLRDGQSTPRASGRPRARRTDSTSQQLVPFSPQTVAEIQAANKLKNDKSAPEKEEWNDWDFLEEECILEGQVSTKVLIISKRLTTFLNYHSLGQLRLQQAHPSRGIHRPLEPCRPQNPPSNRQPRRPSVASRRHRDWKCSHRRLARRHHFCCQGGHPRRR